MIKGKPETVEAELTIQDGDLIRAAHKGYLEAAKTLVFVDGANVNASRSKQSGGATPLVNASQNGHLNIVKFLVGQHAEVDKPIKEGITALMVASQNGHSLIVQYLLEHDADVSAKTTVRGLTAIFLAAERGHVDVVNLLVAGGANVDIARKDNGDRPIIAAAKRGNVEILVALMAAEASINVARTDHGATPLMAASMNGHVHAVRILITAEARLNARSTVDGTTSVFMAAQNGHLRVLVELIKAGADVNVCTTDDDSSPLIQAAWKGNLDCVKVLMANGAELNHQNKCGATALIVAAEKGWHKVVQELLCVDEDLATFALKDNYREEVKRYIARRDHTEYKKDKFRSWGVLQRALHDKSVDVKLLNLQPAEVNIARTDTGYTALMAATQGGHVKIVKLLLASHAEVNVRNTAGVSALYLACMTYHQEQKKGASNESKTARMKVVQSLISAGADDNILHDYEHSHPRLSTDGLPHKGRELWATVRKAFHEKGGVKAFHDPIDMREKWRALRTAVKGHRRMAREQVDTHAEWAMLRQAVHDPTVNKSDLVHVSGQDAWKSLQKNVMVKNQYSAEASLVDFRNSMDIEPKNSSTSDNNNSVGRAKKEPKHEWHILRDAAHHLHERKHREKEALRNAQYRYALSSEVAKAGKKRAELDIHLTGIEKLKKITQFKLPAFMWARSKMKGEAHEEENKESEGEAETEAEKETGKIVTIDEGGDEVVETAEEEGGKKSYSDAPAGDASDPDDADGDLEEPGDSNSAANAGGVDDEGHEEDDEERGEDVEKEQPMEDDDGDEVEEREPEEAAAPVPTPPEQEKSSKGGFFGRMRKMF